MRDLVDRARVVALAERIDERAANRERLRAPRAPTRRRSPSRTRRGRSPCDRRGSRRGGRSRRARSSSKSFSPSSRRKVTAKLTPTTPPESRIASSCASVRFRVDAHSACAFECVATTGRSEISATSQNPRSFRCETSTRMPSSLHARTSARPASVRPGPVSGDAGNSNGTPSANAFGRDQTMPIDRSPRVVPVLQVRQILGDRLGAFHVHDRGDLAFAEVVDRPARRTGSEHSVSKSSSVIRAASSNGIGSRDRHGVRRRRRVAVVRRGDVDREEPAGEPHLERCLQVEMLGRLTSPPLSTRSL